METTQLNFTALLDLTKAIESANALGLTTLKENLIGIAENLSKQHFEDSKTLPSVAEQTN